MDSNLSPIFGNNQAFPKVFIRVVEKLELFQRSTKMKIKLLKMNNKTIRKDERDSGTSRGS